MDLPCYLAVTGAEFFHMSQYPEHLGWMACHFSDSSSGLSNLPMILPPQSMLILNDQFPPNGHDQETITKQLTALVEKLDVSSVLLDFETASSESADLAKHLCLTLPCPVAVTELYGHCTSGPVLLEMPPPHRSLQSRITPWSGRELWLELVPETQLAKITEDGCRFLPAAYNAMPDDALSSPQTQSRYKVFTYPDHAEILVGRQWPQLLDMLAQAYQLGFTRSVGLYQQLAPYINT